MTTDTHVHNWSNPLHWRNHYLRRCHDCGAVEDVTAQRRSEIAKKAAATRARRDASCLDCVGTGKQRTYDLRTGPGYEPCRTCAGSGARQDAQVNPFEVGDILYGTWGYDQTNVEFWQVVAVTKATVKIRPIDRLTTTIGGALSMTTRDYPAKDRFTGKAVTKRVNRAGTVKLYDFGGILSKWDGGGKVATHYA